MREGIEERKGLLAKLAEAGKILVSSENDSPYTMSRLRSNVQRAKRVLGYGLPPARTDETEKELQELFRGTPLYQILEDQQTETQRLEKIRTDYPDFCWFKNEDDLRQPLNRLADEIRAKRYTAALEIIAKPIEESCDLTKSYFSANDNAWRLKCKFLSPRDRNLSDYYGNFKVIGVDTMGLADSSIVAGRLANKIGKDNSKYLKIAEKALDAVSVTIGGIEYHLKVGEKLRANLDKVDEEVEKRKQILELEFGRKTEEDVQTTP